MATLDWLIILAYFVALAGLTWWVLHNNKDTAEDYFLAGRGLGWFVVGASIFASNIGSEHLVGLAGAGATSGVALAHYELHAWCLLVLGWVLVPFYLRSRVFTTPEFLERRFSGTARWVLSLVSVVGYILTKIAVSIFAGGVVFASVLPDLSLQLAGHTFNSFWVGSVAVVVLTGMYTVVGGMRAVAYTEVLQTLRARRRLTAADGLRAQQARRVERVASDAGPRDVQPVEAARPTRHGGHVAARQRSDTHGVVLQ